MHSEKYVLNVTKIRLCEDLDYIYIYIQIVSSWRLSIKKGIVLWFM